MGEASLVPKKADEEIRREAAPISGLVKAIGLVTVRAAALRILVATIKCFF